MHKRTIILTSSVLAACVAAIALLWLLGSGLSASAAPISNAPLAELHVCPSGCAYSSIQAAVDAAGPGDVIKVAQGTYSDVHHTASLDTATFTATQIVAITKSVTIQGGYTTADWSTPDPQAHPTILDAKGQGRGIAIAGVGITPTIEGLRITGGDATGLGGIWSGSFWTGHAGGGIYIYQATATISDNFVYSNTAPISGGVLLYHSAATLSSNSVYSNSATNGSGGGVYVSHGQPTLSDNSIYANQSNGWGGGIYISVSSTTLERNVIHGNSAYNYGGGVAIDGDDATLSGNRIYSNTAPSGGGIYVYNSANAIVSGNIITGNNAAYGGGVGLEWGKPTLLNNVVADNQATICGSGLYVCRSSPRLLHTTIAHNSGGDGSGVYVAGQVGERSHAVLTNTIIFSHSVGITVTAGNTATLNGTLWHANSPDYGGNVIHTHDHSGDPAFAAGGYHLTSGSAALDRGVDAGVTTDINGDARPQGAGYDLGADEFPSAPPSMAWEKQIRVGGGSFQDWDAGPFTVAPGEYVTIVEQVWVTATGSVSFTLGDVWTPSLDWVSAQASTGTVSHGGRTAAWTAPTAIANTWHVLTKTFVAVAAPDYADTLTETLLVEGASLQLPERIVRFQHPRPQPRWEKTVQINGGAPQAWNAGPFTVADGDTLTIVDRVWVTHTASVTF
ncbi:MAG: right-handed parallel beta-helix repeat-containing protein, partial [Actinomycetia bacterium]|nr:right-handed parallel beta-helix repeat-containing protein [Actinomycetes bacterium]